MKSESTPPAFPQRSAGSALLVTLLVVSLLLVMVLSLVVVVRMELRKVVAHQELMQARANAKLGADLAIAKLQEMLGPDTRVSAPSKDPAATNPHFEHITQVVDTAPYTSINGGSTLIYNENYAQTLGYFFSHPPLADPNALPPADFLENTLNPFDAGGDLQAGYAPLVHTGTVTDSDDYIAAPLLPILSPDTANEGSFAYWIRDEGTKGQINLSDPFFESSGDRNSREQISTVQRSGTEVILDNFEASNPAHNAILGRSIEPEHFNMITGMPLGQDDFFQDNYHHITLQSTGLPVNTRNGGLKRDLTAVLKEAENQPDGLPGGSEYDELLSFQNQRLQRWRAETLSLPNARPANLPVRHWTALGALTLRQEQADSVFQNLIFPPNSDMALLDDLGGASWNQLISFATLRQRDTFRNADDPENDRKGLHPVLAKFVMSVYYTVDYPEVNMHFIPIIVLWNPYSEPLRIFSPNLEYSFKKNVLGNFPIRFLVSHPNWSAPASKAGSSPGDKDNFDHIQPKDELWTPGFELPFLAPSTQNFRFNLQSASGDSFLELPPGSARMFSIHESHQSKSYNATLSVTLREGLDPSGYFSFYRSERITDNEFDSANVRINNTYKDARGGYNHWHSRQIRTQEGAEHYPYPFPLDYTTFDNPTDRSLLVKEIPPGNESMAINRNGLDGWTIHAIGLEIGRHNEDSSNLMATILEFRTGGTVLSTVRYPNQQLPKIIQKSRAYHEDTIVPVYPPPLPPADSVPFVPDDTQFPGFPGWGLSWGLRLPDHSYFISKDLQGTSSSEVTTRWLTDFNPAAPFQTRDPVSRVNGNRYDRGGLRSAANYIGGFFMGDDRFADLAWTTPDDLHQFIGHSDDSLPGYAPGDRPTAILYEIPESTEDFVSMASFMHAAPFGKQHPLSGSGLDLAKNSANYNFAAPAYVIGNSNASLLIPPEAAVKTYYPQPGGSLSQTIPFSPVTGGGDSFFSGYDASWLYNYALWDDFFLTPKANRRLQWDPEYSPSDPNQDSTYSREFNASAERLSIQGAFNINSTSVRAWEILLNAMMEVDLETGDSPVGFAAFSRFLDPVHSAYDPEYDTFESKNAFGGYRRLSSAEITNLAEQIVQQVQLRGPFLSLADFVNRALLPDDPLYDPNDLRLSGALQSAVDASGLNDTMGTELDPSAWIDPATHYVGTWSGVSAFQELYPNNTRGRKTVGASGTLMQADILARIGSVLTARSDTFTVRAFGSLGSEENPAARAWCEVIVQRDHTYMNEIENTPTDPWIPRSGGSFTDLSQINQKFGRRFRVVSFRWLSEEEI